MRHRDLSIIGGSLLLAGCSTAHPVLYPNAHMQSVGKEVAAQDIEACRQLAEAAGAEEGSGKAGRVATGTAVGAGVGAASGAVGGAIFGAAGRGSMIGAASGAGAAIGPILYRRRPLPTKSGLFEFRKSMSAREGV
jgi:hypothetical protein